MSGRSGDGVEAARERYYSRLADAGLAPLWTFFHDWFTPVPRLRSVPWIWRYAELRDLVLEAVQLIGPAEAERRVVVLENPGLDGRRLATETLYAGLQIIMPGETAPCHRHSPAALRFVLEGQGAYTTVDGERAAMQPGDLIVTPPWSWHEHGHDGDGPTVWLDVLDVAMVHLFNASFAELQPGRPSAAAAGDGAVRGHRQARAADVRSAVPAFSYPYARQREALARRLRDAGPDPYRGVEQAYADPTTGEPAVATLATSLQLLPAGFATRPWRSTAGALYCVAEGTGRVTVGEGETGRVFDYGPRDIVVVPSWMPRVFSAATETVAFCVSDESAQRRLGFFREARS